MACWVLYRLCCMLVLLELFCCPQPTCMWPEHQSSSSSPSAFSFLAVNLFHLVVMIVTVTLIIDFDGSSCDFGMSSCDLSFLPVNPVA